MSLHERVEAALRAGRPERAWDLAARAFDEGSPRQRHQAVRLLGALVGRVPDSAWIAARSAVAARAGLVRTPRGGVVGEVAFPTVAATAGCFVHARVRAVAGPDRLPELDPGALEQVSEALRAARSALGSELGFVLTFDRDDWSGESCGLAVGLAAVSAARGLPVPDAIVASGALDASGRVHPAGHLHRKLELRAEARPRARLLVAREDAPVDPAVVPVSGLDEALEAIAPSALDDPEEALLAIRAHDRRGEWVEAARKALDLVERPELTEEERVEVLTILLAAANHGAATDDRDRWLRRLDRMTSPRAELQLARFVGARAIAAIDAFDVDRAREALALAGDREWGAEARLHVDGPRALLATLCGQHDRALALRRANLEHAPPAERARCGGDLADALLRAQEPERALDVVRTALREASAPRRRAYQVRSVAWLRLHEARALQALAHPDEALSVLDRVGPLQGPDPWLRIELLRIELQDGLAHLDAIEAGLPAALRASPLIAALFWRTRARLGDVEAARQLTNLPVFAGLPFHEAARRLPY